jgi:hypothetical protein
VPTQACSQDELQTAIHSVVNIFNEVLQWIDDNTANGLSGSSPSILRANMTRAEGDWI